MDEKLKTYKIKSINDICIQFHFNLPKTYSVVWNYNGIEKMRKYPMTIIESLSKKFQVLQCEFAKRMMREKCRIGGLLLNEFTIFLYSIFSVWVSEVSLSVLKLDNKSTLAPLKVNPYCGIFLEFFHILPRIKRKCQLCTVSKDSLVSGGDTSTMCVLSRYFDLFHVLQTELRLNLCMPKWIVKISTRLNYTKSKHKAEYVCACIARIFT